MQNNNRKTQNNQLPIQVVAENHFHALIADFFNSNELEGHVKNLTSLCLAFTGSYQQSDDLSRLEIVNMIFAADTIRDFIIDIENQYHHGEDMSDIEVHEVGKIISCTYNVDVVRYGLSEFLFPTFEDLSIEYLKESLDSFKLISDLITLCSKIHLTNENKLEGATSC